MSESPERHREQCYRCFRPRLACVCQAVPQVHNRTGVFVLQHPRERLHPFGTARLLRLGLSKISVEVAAPREGRPPRLSTTLPANTALLYPSAHAQQLETLAPADLPANLLVVDGTWRHAKALYRANPWLSDLPHVRLEPNAPGKYRIRREPAAHCISTVEAVVQALQFLEPDTSNLDGLIDAFSHMIDEHLRLRSMRPPNPYQKARPRPPPKLPRELLAHNLVVVYGEFVRCGAGKKLVAWAAHRMRTGEDFWCVANPLTSGVQADQLARIGIGPEEIAAAVPLSELVHRWQMFVSPEERLVGWHQSTLDLLSGLEGASRAATLLKAAYCNLTRGRGHHLEQIVERLDLQPVATHAPGRAGARLGSALALLRHLRQREQF